MKNFNGRSKMAIRTETVQPPTPRNQGDYESAHMTPVTPAEDIRTIMINRVSWGAVSAGIVMALTVHLILNLLGVGLGVASLGPDETVTTATTTTEAGTISFGAMIWWTVAGIVAALAGGFTAGRLAGEPKEATAGWHGLTSWAGSVLVIAVLVSVAAGGVIGGNMQAISDMTVTRDQSAVLGAPDADTTAATGVLTMPPDVTVGNTTVDTEAAADALAGVTLISAIGLILGAIAAWFGGRAGAVKPTVTDRSLRYRPMH